MSLKQCIHYDICDLNSSEMNLSGSIFVLRVLFAAAIAIGSTTAYLPSCNSRLRFLLPKWFKHCDCTYSDWSEWEPVPNTIGTDVSSTCESGQAFNETRRQMTVGESCQERAENRTICKFECLHACMGRSQQLYHCK